MRNRGIDTASARIEKRASGFTKSARRVHHVIHNDTGLAFDITDDIHDLRHIGHLTTLVDNGQIDV